LRLWAYGHHKLKLCRDWLDQYTWGELEALAKEDRAIERVHWQRASAIAAAALNAPRGKKDKKVPYDVFVPKNADALPSSDLDRARHQLALFDKARAGFKGAAAKAMAQKRAVLEARIKELSGE
jgi:hypothetical protein